MIGQMVTHKDTKFAQRCLTPVKPGCVHRAIHWPLRWPRRTPTSLNSEGTAKIYGFRTTRWLSYQNNNNHQSLTKWASFCGHTNSEIPMVSISISPKPPERWKIIRIGFWWTSCDTWPTVDGAGDHMDEKKFKTEDSNLSESLKKFQDSYLYGRGYTLALSYLMMGWKFCHGLINSPWVHVM